MVTNLRHVLSGVAVCNQLTHIVNVTNGYFS